MRLVNYLETLNPGPLTALAAVLLLPAIALAQEAVAAVSDLVADGGDMFATIYLVGAGVVIFGLGALVTWGASKLKGTPLKEIAGRFLKAFSVGLSGAHARFKQRLDEARQPSSPGGVVITNAEWDVIRLDMWSYLKAVYGSAEGVTNTVKLITGVMTEEAAKAWVDSKIDAGIADLERVDRAAAAGNLPGPA